MFETLFADVATHVLQSNMMPRYFFDLHDDTDSPDDEGKELPDDGAARARGIAEAVEMIAAAATEHGKIDLAHWVRVRRENGETLVRMKFEEAVEFVRGGEPV